MWFTVTLEPPAKGLHRGRAASLPLRNAVTARSQGDASQPESVPAPSAVATPRRPCASARMKAFRGPVHRISEGSGLRPGDSVTSITRAGGIIEGLCVRLPDQ
ncbi:hypothetical protein GCM10023405_14970 [Streptomonospora salina]